MRGRLQRITAVAIALAWVACGDEPDTASIEQPIVVVSPASHDFGLIELATTSPPRTFTVSPELGFQEDVIASISSCPNFPVTAPGVPGASVYRRCSAFGGQGYGGSGPVTCISFEEQSYDFTVQFTPSVPGPASCAIVINLGSSVRTVTVSGTGKLPDRVVDIGPGAINFGDVRETIASSPAMITVRNVGALGVTVAATNMDTQGVFSVTGPVASHLLPPATTETFAVRCTPPSSGTFSATLRFTTNAPNQLIVDVALTCRGVDSDLAIDPSPAPLVLTRVGAPVDIRLDLTNEGNVVATIDDITFAPGTHPDLEIVTRPAPGSTLAIDATVPVVVRYHATTAHRGPLGSLIVKVANEADREVALAGDALLATVKSEPPELDFGPLCVNRTAVRTLDVFAEADGAFTVSGFTSTDAPFSTQSTTLPKVAEPLRLSDVRFVVTAAPTEIGAIESSLVVATDAPLQTMYPVRLRVQGLGAGVTATPSQLTFEHTIVAGYTAAQTVYFTNCSSDPVEVIGATIDGAGLEDFAITKIRPSTTPTLEPSQTMELDVQMTPRTPGAKVARLVIEYGGGTQTVDLSGTAVRGPTHPRETYYACSTGNPGSCWHVLVALWPVMRSRRARKRTGAGTR